MLRWQSAKSYRTGSSASSARNDAVMSDAIFQPGEARRVNRRHFPTRIVCVSSGTTSCRARNQRPPTRIDAVAANHPAQKQVQPLAGGSRGRAAEEVVRAGVARRAAVDRPQIDRPRAARECLERVFDIRRGRIETSDERALEEPSLCDQTLQNPATRPRGRSPRVQRCTRDAAAALSRAGSNSRTNAAGAGPITAHIASMDAMTDATRPNASPAAMNADDFAIVERARTAGRSESGRARTPDD